jgi:phospholipid/cholesterol/gamma-HCH transport system permease protein
MPIGQSSPAVNAARAEPSVYGERLACGGDWTVHGTGGLSARLAQLAPTGIPRVVLDCAGIDAFDTAGAWLLVDLVRRRAAAGQTVVVENLRAEYQVLLKLVEARAPQAAPAPRPRQFGPIEQLGYRTWRHFDEARGMLAFLGESTLAFLRRVREPRHWRLRLVLHNIQHAGFDALPIVGLLSFLIGVVIAYQAATQLARYGANIFIVDLIGHSILRELGPMMVAVIVAGRSGSAYAAQIGTMKVSEEIDALRTMGVSPFEVLVLPKMIALVIVLPLLTFYADVVGVFGGFLVANLQLDVDGYSFLDRFDDTIRASTFLFGIGKAPVFAMIIALVGCYQGFRAAGSADSVGRQTTLSVVQSIFLVIIADAIFSVLANVTSLGFR